MNSNLSFTPIVKYPTHSIVYYSQITGNMRVSIRGLLDIAANKLLYHQDICSNISVRCRKQLLLLEKIGTLNKSCVSMRKLYADTIEFADVFSNIDGDNSLALSKHMLNKFEFLDARHSTVIESFADVVHSLPISDRTSDMEANINSYIACQSSLSLLLQHGFHLSSKKFYHSTGCVRHNVNIFDICEGAKEHALSIAEHHYTRCPDVIIGPISMRGRGTMNSSICATCVPSHIRFITLELLKNAIASVIRQEALVSSSMLAPPSLSQRPLMHDLPPPILTVLEFENEIRVQIDDQGIGFEGREATPKFASSRPVTDSKPQQSYQPSSAPLNGLGAGLSVSKIYAEQFGGSLLLTSSGIGKGARAVFTIPRDLTLLEPE